MADIAQDEDEEVSENVPEPKQEEIKKVPAKKQAKKAPKKKKAPEPEPEPEPETEEEVEAASDDEEEEEDEDMTYFSFKGKKYGNEGMFSTRWKMTSRSWAVGQRPRSRCSGRGLGLNRVREKEKNRVGG